MQWEVVIGLEIHAQLATKSKIFSGSSTAYGAEPNTQANAVDLGMPGVLPVMNKQALNMAIKFGTAIDAEIGKRSVFDRKNYFYPDLPKGYQTTQLALPIVGRGEVEIELADGSSKIIGVTRAHLEEDAGKSLHENFHGATGVDLNRAGTPLIEIVSEPDMRSPEEAVAYMRKIHSIVTYIGICDGNMQEGSFRCDANVSMRPKGQEEFGTRAELKNINSFRFVERAINVEIERQIDILESGGKVVQETRLYDSNKNETRSMRSKEDAMDYRYFPDPDLLPIVVTDDDIDAIRKTLPELPAAKKTRFINDYGLNAEDAGILTASIELANYFESVAKECGDTKLTSNWVIGELAGRLNKEGLSIKACPVRANQFAGLLMRIKDNTISGKIAKEVFDSMWLDGGDADSIIETKGLTQISDTSELEALADKVIAENPAQVEQFKAGKEKLMGFFVGQIMKETQGKANPGQINQLLKKKLS